MKETDDPTAKARRVWQAIAPRYDRDMSFFERTWFVGGREWVCCRAVGDVLEVAIGTGRNLPLYPATVTLSGVDLTPAMLAIARTRAADLGLSVDLREADAEDLPFSNDHFDTVVCTLSLCSIPNHAKAITEMARVLRPGGRLLLLDHIGSRWWPLWIVQRFVDVFTVRNAGEYQTRRPAPLLAEAGLEIVESQQLKLGTVERVHARKLVR
jgi:ubiquinone/menaquinone biosynthesis C-methylase UbiE